MEPVIQKYHTALETKDFEALAELFTKNGHYCDYCANGTSQHEFHCIGCCEIVLFRSHGQSADMSVCGQLL